jgi:DNA-binding NarL/FixJ family response regulator
MSLSRLYTAVHALDLEESAWIDALFAEGRGLFDEGLGLFVYSYRVGTGPALRLGSLAGESTAPGVWQALERWGGENAGVLAPSYSTGAGGIEGLSVGLRGPLRDLRARFEPLAVADLLMILAHDPDGFGVFLTAPRPRLVRLDARARRSLDRLAAELGAVLRLREARRQADHRRLSASERRVIALLARGASDKEIALELGVGLSTVSTFAGRARKKLGCPPGAEALLTSPAQSERHRRELFARLTTAECDIAADLLLGRSYAEIARRRGSSPRTIAAQCSLIFRKCAAPGRRALAAALLDTTATSGK